MTGSRFTYIFVSIVILVTVLGSLTFSLPKNPNDWSEAKNNSPNTYMQRTNSISPLTFSQAQHKVFLCREKWKEPQKNPEISDTVHLKGFESLFSSKKLPITPESSSGLKRPKPEGNRRSAFMCHFQNAKKDVQRDSSDSTFLNVPFLRF
jgi:hypothetical protein